MVWPFTLPPPTYPLLPVVSTGMKLLWVPIGPEIFRRKFVETRVLRKVTASVPCLEKLMPWATWSLLRYFLASPGSFTNLKTFTLRFLPVISADWAFVVLGVLSEK